MALLAVLVCLVLGGAQRGVKWICEDKEDDFYGRERERERERGMRLGVHGMVTITISSMVTQTRASMKNIFYKI